MARRASRLALLTLFLVLVAGVVIARRPRPVPSGRVVIERDVQGARGVAPVPEFLLRHARELALSPAQQDRIQHLAAAYRKDIAPTQKALDAAASRYRAYLAKKPRGTPEELSQQAGETSRLSAVVATTRASYWAHARKVLTPSQQRAADALAHRACLSDLT